MTTQIPPLSQPLPTTTGMNEDEFNAAMNTFIDELTPYGQAINMVATEIEDLAIRAEAAAGGITNVAWVSGTTYTAGDVRYSPVDFLNYRRKTNGAGTTDPGTDSANWALLTKTNNGGVETTASATDITLTSTSNRLQIVSMTAADKKLILPSATLLSKGAALFVVKNVGLYRFALRNSNGQFICNINPGQIISVHCSDTSTAAGVWHVSGQDVDILYDGNAAEVLTAVAVTDLSVAMFTATKAICAFRDSATGYLNAVIINFGSPSGTPVAINAEASSHISIAAQSNNQATVIYKTSTGITKAYVLDNPSLNNIVPGPVATIDGTSAGTGTAIEALSTTKLVCAMQYQNAGLLREKILDIAINVITPGTAVNPDSANASANSRRIIKKIAADKALASFLNTSGDLIIRLQSITGSTLAPTGAALTLTMPPATSGDFNVIVLSASRALVLQPRSSDLFGVYATLIDISGTSPLLVTTKTISTGVGGTNNHVRATLLSANNVYVEIVSFEDKNVYALVVNVTAEDRLIATPASMRVDKNITATLGYIDCTALDATHVIHVARNGDTYLSAKTIEVSV